MLRSILLAATISLSLSCAHTPSSPRLPLPPVPPAPTVSADELRCVTDDAYRRLVLRERVFRAHILTLEAIIKTTHKGTP